jgi:hypothetical protein
MSEEKTQLTVYLPPDLVRYLKHRRADTGNSVSDLVADLVRRDSEEATRPSDTGDLSARRAVAL